MKKTQKPTLDPPVVVPPLPGSAPTDPLITLPYSQLTALLHETQHVQQDVRTRLAKYLHQSQETEDTLLTLPAVFQNAIANVKEPRRQRKVRQMKARVGYKLSTVKTKQQFAALNSIGPGEAQILLYVGTHRHPGVQDIAIGTELSVKTVKNCASTLIAKQLIVSVKL